PRCPAGRRCPDIRLRLAGGHVGADFRAAAGELRNLRLVLRSRALAPGHPARDRHRAYGDAATERVRTGLCLARIAELPWSSAAEARQGMPAIESLSPLAEFLGRRVRSEERR